MKDVGSLAHTIAENDEMRGLNYEAQRGKERLESPDRYPSGKTARGNTARRKGENVRSQTGSKSKSYKYGSHGGKGVLEGVCK